MAQSNQNGETRAVQTLAEILPPETDMLVMQAGSPNVKDKDGNWTPGKLYNIPVARKCLPYLSEFRTYVNNNWNGKLFAGLTVPQKIAKATELSQTFEPKEAAAMSFRETAAQNILARMFPEALVNKNGAPLSASQIRDGFAEHVVNMLNSPELTEKYLPLIEAELAVMRAWEGERNTRGGDDGEEKPAFKNISL